MKGRPVEELVYECMFPRPKSTDPQNFNALLQRNLIPEVRQETQAFYGHLDTQEAKYPGLDYTNKTHRIRLSRWPWHNRIFRAFNFLGLTHAEISALTKWEGTKWAKEKFEKEQGVVIRDTTADGFPDWVEPTEVHRVSQGRAETRTAVVRPLDELQVELEEEQEEEEDDDQDEAEEESDEEELSSVGVELNERLLAQAARREAGDTSAVLDEEWEQWLKYAIETGELNAVTEQMTEQMSRRATSSLSVVPTALIPPTMLSAARAGQWAEIPEFLQPVLRRSLDAEERGRDQPQQQPQAPADPSPRRQTASGQMRSRLTWSRQAISDLRLSVAGATPASRTARAPGA